MDNENSPLEPIQTKGGSWKYDFACMDIGDVMHCPLMDGETHAKAQARVLSAAISWYKKGSHKGYKFKSQRRNKYIKITRIQP